MPTQPIRYIAFAALLIGAGLLIVNTVDGVRYGWRAANFISMGCGALVLIGLAAMARLRMIP